MKKILMSVIILVFICAGSISILSGCNIETDSVTYVSLNINPSLEFIVDTANRVVAVNSVNDEGAFLVAYDDYEGESIERVVEKFVSLSAESGMIDVDETNNLIYLSVVNENSATATRLFNSIKTRVDNYCKTNGVYALVARGVLSEELLELAKGYDISAGHLRLILKAMELNPDLTIDELINININELVEIINNDIKNYGQMCRIEQKEEYKEERLALKMQYIEDVKTLFGSEYIDLLNELELLELQLNSESGVALENLVDLIDSKKGDINTIKITLEQANYAELNILKTNYKTSVQALVDEYIGECALQKNALQSSLEGLIDENENKLEQRQSYANKQSNNFRAQYEDWKNNIENDLINFIMSNTERLNNISQEINNDLAYAINKAQMYVNLYGEIS